MARTLPSILAGIALATALTLSSSADAAIVPVLKQPSWVELTPQQREILAPLATEWDKLEIYRRKKWLGIAQRYPGMSADEQQRLQERMKTWINLSAEDRKRAREQYKTLKKAPPEQRQVVNQKWQEYKNLPDADKEKLKQMAVRKPQPKSGAGKGPNPVVIAPTPSLPGPAPTPSAAPATVPLAPPAPAQ